MTHEQVILLYSKGAVTEERMGNLGALIGRGTLWQNHFQRVVCIYTSNYPRTQQTIQELRLASYYLERVNESQVVKCNVIVVILDVTECLLMIFH